MKTAMSRFHIHDELTAPEGSEPILRGALANSPAALRGYARFRSELRRGTLPLATLERIALAVAQHHDSQPGLVLHARTARNAGLTLDEVSLARRFDSADPKEQALLRFLQPLLTREARPQHTVEEAREAGWSDEQLLEAIAYVAMESFTAMVNVAG